MEHFTLFELNEYIKRILALNLDEPIWVQCELAQVNFNRGHYYIELIQKDDVDTSIIAQSSAVLWRMDHYRLKKEYGDDLEHILQEGLEVILKVVVEFHERYGLKLVVKDVDLSYILGKHEIEKRKTLEELVRLDIIEKNGNLELPQVIQNIAVISSEKAAGFQDFKRQLLDNAFGYHFEFQLFEIAVQGKQVAPDFIAQMNVISELEFDAIAIMRGGGSKLDLSGFDELEVAKAIAESAIPVITGIGHEIDDTVADLVAHTSVKTPTAVADFFVEHNYGFEATITQIYQNLNNSISLRLQNDHLYLERQKEVLRSAIQRLIYGHEHAIHTMEEKSFLLIANRLKAEHKNIENASQILELLSIGSTLKRGFAMVQQNDHYVSKTEDVDQKDEITIHLAKGKMTANITTIDNE